MSKQFATLDFARLTDDLLAKSGIVPEDIATFPTQKVPSLTIPRSEIVARISNPRFVRDAQAVMLPGETPDALFVRLLLFYRHNTKAVDE